MNSLAATLTCLIPGRQQPVHRAYRTVITTLIKQDGIDGGRRHVCETRAVEQTQQ
jgi:hypothetical protein